MRRFGFCLALLTLLLHGLVLSAQAQQGQLATIDDIASAVDANGSYLDGQDIATVAADAVERANADDVGFVYLDQENGEDLEIIANDVLEVLDARGSSYQTLIVLDASGVYVVSSTNDAAGAAADAATPDFARGAIGGGIDTVLDILNGGTETAGSAATDGTATSGSTENAASDTSGGGVPWLLILFLGLAAFLAVRFFTSRRRKAAALETAMAEDRAEIREQLRNNADHVIDLGDRIATADDDIRRMYEEAAQTFQDVSLGLDDATTAAEIDALDDRLDRAEWQFEFIEARLDGRTPPPEPRSGEGPIGRGSNRPGSRQPVPPLGRDRQASDRSAPSDRPAMGADESLFPGSRRQQQPRQRSRRRRGGGMLGGLAKTGLMALVLKMLLGGGLGLSGGSRRTQQRRNPNAGSGGFGGGVGGGVLR